MYAGHWDNYIYKYYAEMLNDNYYNKYCDEIKIDECITAYRNNKPQKSNIDFAAEIINQIAEYEEAYILVGDFTNYFDKIDHLLLKERLKNIMNVSWIPKDWHNVYRSITRYGYYEKDFIEQMWVKNAPSTVPRRKSYFDTVADFRIFQKEHRPETNPDNYGIPQGTAISAVLANVYALEFDIKLKEIADEYSGMYRRYSDDFILVIPKAKLLNKQEMWDIEKKAREIAADSKIIIQEEKTGLFLYEDRKVFKLNDSSMGHLDYLGFVFDGITVKMRGKSPYKFYRKARQLIDIAQETKKRKNLKKLPYRKSIYKMYTDLGTSKSGRNSFIDYAKRAQRIFDKKSPKTQNMMLNQIKNRKKKIEKMLGIKIHTKI